MPYLYEANGRLADWKGSAQSGHVEFTLQAHVPLEFALANARGCQVKANGQILSASSARSSPSTAREVQQFRIPHATAHIQIKCPDA